MLCTTVHVPDLVTTLMFPADFIQHQQSVLTLATHLPLTVPIITWQQSWNIISEKESHQHTLQLPLATITLKQYHLVWHTVMNESPVTQPRIAQNAVPYPLHDIDLPKDGVTYDHNPRWFMLAIGSFPTGEVRSLDPRSKWWCLIPIGHWS